MDTDRPSGVRFRYGSEDPWLKGNTHIHSTASDGRKTFAELADMYARAGYDFLFRTDHAVAADCAADNASYPLLWLDGMELHGVDERGALYHVVVLGRAGGFREGMDFGEALAAAAVPGNLAVLAHPCWTGNSLEDALCKSFGGVEVYNHVCRSINGRGDGSAYWSAMLDRNPDTLSFACDDAHLSPAHPGWNGGWIAVQARACTRRDIMSSILRGSFYSSRGPQFRSLTQTAERGVRAETSPVQSARLVGPRYRGISRHAENGRLLTHVAFEIPADWAYAYLEIEDAQGRRAWTNPLFANGTTAVHRPARA